MQALDFLQYQTQIFSPWISRSSTVTSPHPRHNGTQVPKDTPILYLWSSLPSTLEFNKLGVFQLFLVPFIHHFCRAPFWTRSLDSDLHQGHFPEMAPSILQNVAQAPLCISLLGLSQQSTTDEESSTTEIYFLIVLEAATVRSRGRQIWILPGPLSLASHCPHAAFSLHMCTHGTP